MIVDPSDVHASRRFEAGAGRIELIHERIFREVPEDGRVEAKAIAKQTGFDPALDLRGRLRAQVSVAGVVGHDTWRSEEHRPRRKCGEFVKRTRRLACLAVRRP